MKVYIGIDGDPSVGIPDFEISFDLGIDDIDEEEREPIRQKLIDCFSFIYNESVGVAFDDEIGDYNIIFEQQNGI
jgi:hypothetical protein